MLNDVNHAHLKINFDVIHLWEAGDDPQQAFRSLAPYINHMHLKNISHYVLLDNFKPENVYSPAGNRTGMIGVFEGAFDFQNFLQFVIRQNQINWQTLDTSLEWFEDNVLHTLNKDRQAIEALQRQYALALMQTDQAQTNQTQTNESNIAV